MKKQKTIFKLSSLSKQLKTRQVALAKITQFGTKYTMYGDKENNYIYIDADSIKDLISATLYRELSAKCTQFIVHITDLKRF
jgi:uncharacterized circularly permuted ATP-grasp superfamily protein